MPVVRSLALCWSHFRRQFYEIAKAGNAPIAAEALERIGALYRIEEDIRCQRRELEEQVRGVGLERQIAEDGIVEKDVP